MAGDFAKYIISPSIRYWTVTTLDLDKALTPHENFEVFRSMLADHANSDQLSAFNEMLEFCIDCNSSEPNTENQKSQNKRPALKSRSKLLLMTIRI